MTYPLISSQYLGRYRTLSILDQILSIDKRLRSERGEPERPREERTPRWFAEMYKKHLANSPGAQSRRIVWSSDDSDIAEGTEGQMRPGRAHVLRHVPTAEVLSLLATHAEWILDEQRSRISRTRFLDMDVWADWVRTAKRVRMDAYKEGVRWGWLDETEPNGPVDSGDEDVVMEEPARARPRPKKKAKPKVRRIPFSLTLTCQTTIRRNTGPAEADAAHGLQLELTRGHEHRATTLPPRVRRGPRAGQRLRLRLLPALLRSRVRLGVRRLSRLGGLRDPRPPLRRVLLPADPPRRVLRLAVSRRRVRLRPAPARAH